MFRELSRFGVGRIVGLVFAIVSWVLDEIPVPAKICISIVLVALLVLDHLLPEGEGLRLLFDTFWGAVLGVVGGYALASAYFSNPQYEAFDPGYGLPQIFAQTGKQVISPTGFALIGAGLGMGAFLQLAFRFAEICSTRRITATPAQKGILAALLIVATGSGGFAGYGSAMFSQNRLTLAQAEDLARTATDPVGKILGKDALDSARQASTRFHGMFLIGLCALGACLTAGPLFVAHALWLLGNPPAASRKLQPAQVPPSDD